MARLGFRVFLEASEEQCFKKMRVLTHPDKSSPDHKARAEEAFKELDNLWEDFSRTLASCRRASSKRTVARFCARPGKKLCFRSSHVGGRSESCIASASDKCIASATQSCRTGARSQGEGRVEARTGSAEEERASGSGGERCSGSQREAQEG